VFARNFLKPIGFAPILLFGLAMPHALEQQPDNVYPTYGVHNPPSDSPCTNSDCVYVREAGPTALSGLLVVELDDVSRVQRLRG
jgi:hypothetical protein